MTRPSPDVAKAAWVARCAARYVDRGGLTPEQAAASAAARYAEAFCPSIPRRLDPPAASPEEWADADMESWDEEWRDEQERD